MTCRNSCSISRSGLAFNVKNSGSEIAVAAAVDPEIDGDDDSGGELNKTPDTKWKVVGYDITMAELVFPDSGAAPVMQEQRQRHWD